FVDQHCQCGLTASACAISAAEVPTYQSGPSSRNCRRRGHPAARVRRAAVADRRPPCAPGHNPPELPETFHGRTGGSSLCAPSLRCTLLKCPDESVFSVGSWEVRVASRGSTQRMAGPRVVELAPGRQNRRTNPRPAATTSKS